MSDFMELERMVYNSRAYSEILKSDEMRGLMEETAADVEAHVENTGHAYSGDAYLTWPGITRRWAKNVNPSGKDNLWSESKAALLRAVESRDAWFDD